jgi:hypothetical protein
VVLPGGFLPQALDGANDAVNGATKKATFRGSGGGDNREGSNDDDDEEEDGDDIFGTYGPMTTTSTPIPAAAAYAGLVVSGDAVHTETVDTAVDADKAPADDDADADRVDSTMVT